jgi:glutaredoxin
MSSRFAVFMMLFVVAYVALPLSAQAQAAYRWVDKSGQVHYTDTPPLPAEAQKVERKPINAGKFDNGSAETVAMRKAMQDFPLTLYSSPSCKESCMQARNFLNQRGVQFTEKSILTPEDAALFKQATKLEDLVVPVLQAGNKIEKGFEENSWRKLIDNSGYPLPAKAGAVPSAPAPSPPSSSGRPPA